MWYDLIVYTPMYVTAFWGIVLISSPFRKNRAKHFLGLFMFAAFLLYLSHALFFRQKLGAYLFMDPVYIFASLSVYPLYYWYIKLLTIETRINYRNLFLLVPAVCFSLTAIIFYIFMTKSERTSYLYEFLNERSGFSELTLLPKLQAGFFILGRLVFTIQVLFFLFNGRKLVKNYNTRIANFYSNLENKTIIWVKYLLYSFVATSLASILFNIIGRSVFIEHNSWLVFPSLIFSVLLFFIGFQGYLQNHTVQELEKDETQERLQKIYKWNSDELKKALLDLFQKEKIHCDPNLKITHISTRLKTNRTYISKLINYEFKTTFSDFVNRYRVEEAKNLLAENYPENYSMNYISETAGFGSLSTFIRIFKKSTGITPGKFHRGL